MTESADEICAQAVKLAAEADKVSTKAFRLAVLAVCGVVALAAFELFPKAAAKVRDAIPVAAAAERSTP